MGLMAALRLRRYVWTWRVRYWWLDTRSGAQARVALLCLGALVVVMQLVRMAVAALAQPAPGAPVQAVYWWVVQLIIMIVAAVVSYAMRPKAQSAAEQSNDPPTVEDGTAVRDYGGTVWIEHEDNFLLGWKVVGRDPIRTKGGKK